jgi:putative phosphoribosyl transferase
MLFKNRRDAGGALGRALHAYAGRADVIVLALPRGGVPVAYEAARALDVPLDVFLVRKLGTPGQPELAMGAIASGGVVVTNEEVVRALGLSPAALDAAVERESRELARREEIYRGGRPWPDLARRTLILVDDGLATGSTMRAAVRAVRVFHPRQVVVGVPVAAASTAADLRHEADEVVCIATPEPFHAVGQWYADFDQTTDTEVQHLLEAADHARPAPAWSPRG